MGKQQFLEDKSDTIRLTVYDKNIAQVPSSANITMYTPSGGSLQAQDTASVNSTTGEMTYSLTSTHTADVDLNYKAVWEYVVSGVTYYQTQLFDVVKSILSIPIVDSDLYDEIESLRETNNQAQGTATAGATGSITDTTKRKEVDNYWKGGTIEILSGTGVGQVRDVTGNTQSTGVVTVSPNWTTTPDTTSVYRIIRSYHYKIEESFEDLQQMIYNKGKRHQLILESSQISVPLKYLTIHKICLDLMKDEGDKWDRLQSIYWDRFNEQLYALKLEYDEDDSGFIQGDEEQDNPTTFSIGRS